MVDVEGNRIVRIRPLKYDWKYKPENVPTFEFKARGITFRTPVKEIPSPFILTYKNRVYSPNRVMYPLKEGRF